MSFTGHTSIKRSNPYIEGFTSTLKVPALLTKKILIKGTPLLLNEALWAAGMAMLTQCYSIRGLNVVAALNIANTINNVFNIVFIALGDSVAIVVGQLLGAGKMKEARDTDTKMIAFSVFCCTGVALLMLLLAPLFPCFITPTRRPGSWRNTLSWQPRSSCRRMPSSTPLTSPCVQEERQLSPSCLTVCSSGQ